MRHQHTLSPLRAVSLLLAATVALLLASCERTPELYLHETAVDPRPVVQFELPMVDINLDIFWDYASDYDWRAEWSYGWDEVDEDLFGVTGYDEPTAFTMRRYNLYGQPNAPHTTVEEFDFEGSEYHQTFDFGYYDLLIWNQLDPVDGVQSLVIDEATTLDSVRAYTNMGMSKTRYEEPAYTRAFYQPEQLFAGYERNFYVSPYIEDYDYLDPVTNIYHKNLNYEIYPVTYVYLTQVRLHNNRGRISGVDGEANLSGMAKEVSLNTGVASQEAITVHYTTRFKSGCTIAATGEEVDIAGGRCMTFGITGQNSSRVSRADEVQDGVRHYMDLNFIFSNGMDSSMVFDVTDQIRRYYKGGVVTIDIDLDTIEIPKRAGGSGFDAVVVDYEEVEYKFDMDE